MSYKTHESSATHQFYTGIINEFLIKRATALTLQVGVLTRPILTSGSCTVTLRIHQNIIKLSQHAHSTVISLCPKAHILSVFLLTKKLVTTSCPPKSLLGPETPLIPTPATAEAVQPPATARL